MTNHRSLLAAAVIGVLCVICECTKTDDRLAQFAERANAQQAAQNQDMSHANYQLAGTTRRLIECDAAARQELIAIQQELREDQAEVGRQRDQLEQERVLVAAARESESRWGAIFSSTASVLVALAPLVLAAIALWLSWRPSENPDLGDSVLEYLAANSQFLSGPDRRRLPDPPDSGQSTRIEQADSQEPSPSS
jgi:hypothetical protein